MICKFSRVPETLKTLPKLQEERVSQREFNCTPISQSVNQSNPFQQERFWYDLVVNQKKNVLNQLPSHILQSHGCFWLTQTQIFNEGSSDRQVESLSEIMQSQLEEVLDDVDCSDRLTLNCGHYTDCGFGCQLHHRAFCALAVPSLRFPKLCSNNSCVTDHKNFAFDASRPVFGVQARRTDKTTEAKKSFHATDEYIHIFEVFFKILENHQDPKTVFIASDDHTFLADIRKSYKLPRFIFPGEMQLRNLWVVIQRMPNDS
ncbi:unnamed protein product [Allacma fusca]|uniref:Alpha-(1,6)-fucosyltransferase N- and catalytic domain-containing protein n=1 Tax=Allacma fusca TaxID=39272 RepID=A0A8J2JFF2_9HEXA|nr:unnamed protein product [Allacma fusca]